MDRFVVRSKRTRSMASPCKLDRFLNQQNLPLALRELHRGKKNAHWIWYVFPQLRGLGSSFMAQEFGLDGVEEAEEFLKREETREQLLMAMKTLHRHRTDPKRTVYAVFQSKTDTQKFISSMTLFASVSKHLRDEEVKDIATSLLKWAQEEDWPVCMFTEEKCNVYYNTATM